MMAKVSRHSLYDSQHKHPQVGQTVLSDLAKYPC